LTKSIGPKVKKQISLNVLSLPKKEKRIDASPENCKKNIVQPVNNMIIENRSNCEAQSN
jgi:hypothetical protein